MTIRIYEVNIERGPLLKRVFSPRDSFTVSAHSFAEATSKAKKKTRKGYVILDIRLIAQAEE